jgi:hypothetical protein
MIASLIGLIVSLAQAAAPPAGMIRGHVYDRDTGAPLDRAVVRVMPADNQADERIAVTDDRGGFAVGGLPPGRYHGIVIARQHDSQSLRADAIPLARNEIVDVVVRVPPTFALDVRVVDPSGEPLSGIEIQAADLDRGRQLMSSMMSGTDDLGHVRLFGIPAGRYTLCANAMATVGRDGTVRRDRLLRTCYPSTDESHAEPVRIDRAGLEGLEIQMRRGRTFTISGMVIDANGAPAVGARADFLHLIPNGGVSSGMNLDGNGQFRVPNAAAGDYAIRAAIPGPDSTREHQTGQIGLVEVHVVDADVDDVVVTLRRTVDVQGRFVAEDGVSPLPPVEGSGLSIEAGLAGTRGSDWSTEIFAMANPDRTFTVPGVFGPRLLRFSGSPRGWYVKAVRYGNRNIIDTPIEFTGGRDAPALEVVLSNRGAIVNGTVTADDGTVVRGSMVYLLRLAGPGGIEVITRAPSSATGAFAIGPVRGGEYVLVALPTTSDVPPNARQDRLKRLVELGERVTLTDLDERSVPLRLVRER